MVTAANNTVADIRRRPVAIQAGLFVYQLPDQARRGDDDGCRRSHLQGIDLTILLGPLGESVALTGSEIWPSGGITGAIR